MERHGDPTCQGKSASNLPPCGPHDLPGGSSCESGAIHPLMSAKEKSGGISPNDLAKPCGVEHAGVDLTLIQAAFAAFHLVHPSEIIVSDAHVILLCHWQWAARE